MRKVMSITRALVELKTLEKRINKKIATSIFIAAERNGELFKSPLGTNVKNFVENAKAKFGSINSLIDNYRRIKKAIINSNAVTKVKINNVEMTVAEAIEKKNSINFQKYLLAHLKEQFGAVNMLTEKENNRVQERLDKLVETNLGKDIKTNSADYEAIAKPFLKNNKVNIVDPINIQTVIAKIEEEIENFEREVDFVLSESNARTEITV